MVSRPLQPDPLLLIEGPVDLAHHMFWPAVTGFPMSSAGTCCPFGVYPYLRRL